jgi:hypothetical protein
MMMTMMIRIGNNLKMIIVIILIIIMIKRMIVWCCFSYIHIPALLPDEQGSPPAPSSLLGSKRQCTYTSVHTHPYIRTYRAHPNSTQQYIHIPVLCPDEHAVPQGSLPGTLELGEVEVWPSANGMQRFAAKA